MMILDLLSGDFMPKRKFLTEEINRILKEGKEPLFALLYLAAKIEHAFFCKLLFERKINPKLINTWTLSKYIEWCASLDLIDNKTKKILMKFTRLRNYVVHTLPRMSGLGNYEFEKSISVENIKNLMLSVCDILDKIEITYKPDDKLEKLYSDYSDMERRKIIDIMTS